MANINYGSDLFNLNQAADCDVNGIPTTTTTASSALFPPDALCPGLLFPPTCTIQADLAATTRLSHRQDNQNAVVMTREEALVTLSEKTSYPILQENGQRRYGPPPDWKGPQPPRGCEVFIGKIPRDCFEDELVPIFEMVGRIYMFRLMMDFSGCNRGYGFCIYTNREDTRRAVAELDSYEIRRGKMLGVCFSVDNCRLFVGGIPKNKTKEEVMIEMLKVTEGVKDVIVYPSVADKTKNRGFAFVEYENHKAAAMARRKLIPGRIHLWGHQIAVDWAEPEREVDEDIMSKVRILYVRNLMLHTTEEALRDHFNRAIGNCDAVERVKKIRDYAFVHFRDRLQASVALRQLDGTLFEGSLIEVTWAKPVDKNEGIRVNRLANNNVTTPVFNMPNFCLPPSRNLHDCDLMNSVTGGYPVLSTADELMITPQVNLGKLSTGLRQMSLFGGDHQPINQLQQTCLATPVSLSSNALSAFHGRIPPFQPKAVTFSDMQKPENMNWTYPRSLVASESAQLGPLALNNKVSHTTSGCSGTSPGCRTDRSNGSDALLFRVQLLHLSSPSCPLSGYGKSYEIILEQMDRSTDATKLLTEVCMKHGLELPKVMTRVHENNISQTDKGYPTFNVQLYLPTVQRYFNSLSPLPSVEEATQSAALVTLQWLSTNIPLLRSSIDSRQKPFLMPELLVPKRDHSLLPYQTYANSQSLSNDKLHNNVNSACPDDNFIQSFVGRTSDGLTETTVKRSHFQPFPTLMAQNENKSTYFENLFAGDNLMARNQQTHPLLPATINLLESDVSRLKHENNFITSAESLRQLDSRVNAFKSQSSLNCKLMYMNQEKEVSSPQIHLQTVENRNNELNPPTTSVESALKNGYFDKSVSQAFAQTGVLNSNHLNCPFGLVGTGDKSVLEHKIHVSYAEDVSQTHKNETQKGNNLHAQYSYMTFTGCSDILTSQHSSGEDRSLLLSMDTKKSTDLPEYSHCFSQRPTCNTVFPTRTI